MIRAIALLCLTACLVACESTTPPPAAAAPASAEPAKTVLDDQLKAIDKAKAVEQQLIDEKRKTDEQIEGAGG